MTRNRTTIEYWEENNAWHATEPDADHDLVGRGQTAPEAVAHYAELVDDSTAAKEAVQA